LLVLVILLFVVYKAGYLWHANYSYHIVSWQFVGWH